VPSVNIVKYAVDIDNLDIICAKSKIYFIETLFFMSDYAYFNFHRFLAG